MTFWEEQVQVETQNWLLESEYPSVRYLTLRDLLDSPTNDKTLIQAQRTSHQQGKIAEILSHMHADGYWEKPGPGYYGKYRTTVWSLITLSQLGASAHQDERIQKACEYYISQSMTKHGQFTVNGAPSTNIECLQGNMLAALLDLGFEDSRLEKAYEWLARSVTGEGVAPMSEKKAELRFYSGNIGPDFKCGANNKLGCAWGAVKTMLAFSRLPFKQYTPLIKQAIQRTENFLFSIDPVTAEYPCGYAAKPSGNWWKFGFPVFYITDLLQLAETMVAMGFGNDPRLANTLQLIRDKQDEQGRWALEFHYTGKMWTDFGERKKPNPWITIRALRVLKNIS